MKRSSSLKMRTVLVEFGLIGIARGDVAAHAVVADEALRGIEARQAAERDPQPSAFAGIDLELQ